MHSVQNKLSKAKEKTFKKKKEFKIKKNIFLNEISFNYKDKNPIFKNLSQNIVKGDIVGVYGPSGVGKSTLLDIITGTKERARCIL